MSEVLKALFVAGFPLVMLLVVDGFLPDGWIYVAPLFGIVLAILAIKLYEDHTKRNN